MLKNTRFAGALEKFVSGFFARKGRGVRFRHAALSGRGLVRTENQDHFFVDAASGLFCVADGMGGGQGGAKASEIVCREISSVPRSAGASGRIAALDESVRAANKAIRDFASDAGYDQMATTVVFLSFDESGGVRAGHVGDSRLYRFRGGRLECLTRDHTVAAEMRGAGWKSLAASRASRLSHVLTRAVGVDREVQVEWTDLDAKPGDRFLLCTDGVYDMIDDRRIEFLASRAKNPSDCCKSLEKDILAAGAADNYTIVAVDFR